MQAIKILIYNFNIWTFLSLHEIRKKYRRSIFGPFWIVISNILVVLVLSSIYSIILKKNFDWYVLYLGVGFIVWQNISSSISEAPESFIRSANLIKTYKMSLLNYIYRDTGKNFLLFIHNLPFWIILIIWFDIDISIYALFFILSYFILFFNMIWICTIVAIISTRFRDFNSIIGTLIQLSFFATPVLWDVSHVIDIRPQLSWIIYINPFYHLIEIFRQPLMSGAIPFESFIFSFSMMIIGNIFASILIKKYSRRIVFWL